MKGTYEYKTLISPDQPTSEGFNVWLKQQYEDGKWELVGPDYTRTNFDGISNSMTQYYIFRKEGINFNNQETII